MTRAIAADTRVAYVAEVTEGVTPATPAFKTFRATGETMDVLRRHIFSSELNGKRGKRGFAMSTANGAGGLNFEFSDETLEDFLESALRNVWSTNVLTDAKTAKPFTLEVTFEQGATDTYKIFKGAHVNVLSLNMRAREIVTGSVEFLTRSGDFTQTAIAGATYAAANSEPSLTGDVVGSIAMSGLTIDCLTGITMNLNNNLSEEFCLGTNAATGIGAGVLDVTGTLGMFLDAGEYDVLRAYADGTPTSLDFIVGTTTLKKTRFELPNVVLSDLKVNAETAEGNVLLSCNYTALQATSLSGAVLRVTRNVA